MSGLTPQLPDDFQPFAPANADTSGKSTARTRNPRTPASTSLRIRRLIAVALIMATFWGLFWLFFSSSYGEPLAQGLKPITEPTWNFLVAVINDPLGIDWGAKLVALGGLIIPHMGMLAIIDDRMR